MSENKKEETNDKKTDAQRSQEAQLEKIERVLANIKPGYTVAVHRARPSWCKGYLERMELCDDDQIDLDYLADTWGGDVLKLRICDPSGTYRASVDIPMYSWPPKFRGKRLYRNQMDDQDEIPKSAQIEGTRTPQPQFIQAPPQQQQSSNNLETILKLLKQTRSEDLATFRSLLDSTSTDVPQVGNQISNFVELAQQFKELQGLFGNAEAGMAAPMDDQAALFQTIGEVAKAVLGNKQAPAPARNPRLVQHKPRSVQEPVQNPPQGMNMAASLANMPADQAADVCFAALTRMDPAKKDQAIGEIMARLGSNPDLDYEEEGEFEDDADPEIPDQSTDVTSVKNSG